MTQIRPFGLATAAFAALLAPGAASATANIGGTIGASFSEALGACNRALQVSNGTLQDTFALNLSAPCAAGFAGGNLQGTAASGAVGLRTFAAGTGSAAAQVSLTDNWILTPPPGTVAGFYLIPVSLHIDGTVSPGATALLGTFLSYSMSLRDINSGLPSSSFSVTGSVTGTGVYSQTFSSMLNVRYFGPGSLLTTEEISVQLSAQQVFNGTVDFYNTAVASLALPAGWTAVTSSGLAVTPVPEPTTAVLMLLGVAALVGRQARQLGRARQAPLRATPAG